MFLRMPGSVHFQQRSESLSDAGNSWRRLRDVYDFRTSLLGDAGVHHFEAEIAKFVGIRCDRERAPAPVVASTPGCRCNDRDLPPNCRSQFCAAPSWIAKYGMGEAVPRPCFRSEIVIRKPSQIVDGRKALHQQSADAVWPTNDPHPNVGRSLFRQVL